MLPPANTLIKRTITGVGVIALIVMLAWALWPKPIAVELANVQKGPLLVTINEEGKTRIKAVYTVSAPITGKLVRLSLEAGDAVEKQATIVAIIEPTAPAFLDVRAYRELEAQVEAAKAAVSLTEAEVRAADVELEFANGELARAQTLSQTKAIPERNLERARVDVDMRKAAVAKAKAGLEVKKRELESARARLIGPEEAWKGEVPIGCCVTVRAPVDGRVLKVIQESERVVSAGMPLVEIGDPKNIDIVVELLSADAVKLALGATATIEEWGGSSLKAKVTRIEPSGFTKVSALGIEEQRVRAVLELQEDSGMGRKLGHDFRVFIRIDLYSALNALRVPISALFRKGDKWSVYVVDGGRARATTVEIGQRNSRYAEVLGGLNAGAVVVLHPSDRITDGARVVAQTEGG